MKFKDKAVVITGAASGIGRATVLRFAAEGARIIAADINETAGQTLAAETQGDVRFKRCDVSSVADIKALMDYAAQTAGGIDVLFNNAGAPGPAALIDEIEAESWDSTMNLLLRSVAMGIRYAVPYMKGRSGASIVNTASTAGLRSGLGHRIYSVAKAGVIHLTTIAAADLARHNIRVNAVLPGLINTNLFAEALNIPREKFERLKPKLAEMSVHAQPVARAGQPDDVASMVLFLASDQASFVTGTHMVIDGGITIGERRSWDPNFAGPLDALLASAD